MAYRRQKFQGLEHNPPPFALSMDISPDLRQGDVEEYQFSGSLLDSGSAKVSCLAFASCDMPSRF